MTITKVYILSFDSGVSYSERSRGNLIQKNKRSIRLRDNALLKHVSLHSGRRKKHSVNALGRRKKKYNKNPPIKLVVVLIIILAKRRSFCILHHPHLQGNRNIRIYAYYLARRLFLAILLRPSPLCLLRTC